jgi:hypothetical protein
MACGGHFRSSSCGREQPGKAGDDGLRPGLIFRTAGVGDRAAGKQEIIGHVDDDHGVGTAGLRMY